MHNFRQVKDKNIVLQFPKKYFKRYFAASCKIMP